MRSWTLWNGAESTALRAGARSMFKDMVDRKTRRQTKFDLKFISDHVDADN